MKNTNLRDIVSVLSRKYNYGEIGQIFSGALYQNRLDKLAFVDVDNSQRLKNLQTKIVSHLKHRMACALLSDYTLPNKNELLNYSVRNEESLLGSVKRILEENGEDGFEMIGKAIIIGSSEYLKDVPLAKHMNADQFKEYRRVKKHLDRV